MQQVAIDREDVRRALNMAMRGIFRFQRCPDLSLIKEAERKFSLSASEVEFVFQKPAEAPACDIYNVVSLLGNEAAEEAERVNLCLWLALTRSSRHLYFTYLIERIKLWMRPIPRTQKPLIGTHPR